MIDYKNVPIGADTKRLIDFFNALAKDLEYPNCEGNEDKRRILLQAERHLILWGKL